MEDFLREEQVSEDPHSMSFSALATVNGETHLFLPRGPGRLNLRHFVPSASRMNLVQPALRRPFTVFVAILAVALTAGLALRQMPRDILPTLGIPTIYISQPYGGMSPAQMEGFLTYYYEYQSLYLTGIEHVESKSIQGTALIKLQFHPGTDMAQAMAETVTSVNRARAFMPPGTAPPFVMRFDVGSVPVGTLVFSSETRGVTEIQDIALSRVRPLFSALPGVSAPPPLGSSARSVVIRLKPDRLQASGLTADEVVSAIGSSNMIIPAGNVRMGDELPMVPVNSTVRDIQELGDVPLRLGALPTVYLRDVATIEDGADITTGYALVNGRRTVYIPVTKRADASTLAVVAQVKANLPKFQALLPDDVKVAYVFDQSPYVTRAIDGLLLEGVLGAFLTGLMVLLFLRDWRTALIVLINIPLALLAAVVVLWLCGQSINVMTLGGLALAVGILVDESTVTVENIHTHLARGRSVAGAALDATLETAVPRLLAMISVLAVFIPSFFMVGAARALFVPLSLAVGFAMVASYLLSSTLVPILATWFLRRHPGTRTSDARSEVGRDDQAERPGSWRVGFARLSATAVRFRWPILAAYLVVVGITLALVRPRLGTEIFPRVEAGQVQLRVKAPTGSHPENTEKVAVKVLALVESEAGAGRVELSLGYAGVPPPNNPINSIYVWTGGPEVALLQIQFKPGVAVEPLKERLRARIAAELPGVQISFEPADLVSRVMSLGSPTPIEIAISGPDFNANRAYATKVREALAHIPALRDLQFGQSLDYPSVEVNVNRARAGMMGVRTADVGRSIVPTTSSSRYIMPMYWADPNSGIAYQVQVQMPQTAMESLEELGNTPITARGGTTVLLRNMATISPGLMIGEYARYNMQRMVSLTANIAGADLGSVAREVNCVLHEMGAPPPRVSVAVRGQVLPMQQLLDGLGVGLLLAVVVIFLLLAASFQSFKVSFVVVTTVPAVVAGVAGTLWLTHTTVNVQSFMGAIMAVGVAVANAILVVTFAERARRAGASAADAAVVAARSRLRAILMTSLAMIAGMMPAALGLGEGGEQIAPLGRAVVGGLAAATLMTLLVLPAIFALVQGRAHRRSASLDPRDSESPQFEGECDGRR